MTFTYGGDLTVDVDFVRFHTGDTTEDTSFLSDEVIASLVTVEGSRERAAVAGIEYIITQLSRPDFQADWLRVSHDKARAGYEGILRRKRAEFGLGTGLTRITATTQATYRADSLQTDANYVTGSDDEWPPT